MISFMSDDFEIERAADIIKQAREIEQDKELMEKVAVQLKKEKKIVEDAVESLPDDLREISAIDPDDENSRTEAFIERIRGDRENEAMKTNESPGQRRKRIKGGSRSQRMFT